MAPDARQISSPDGPDLDPAALERQLAARVRAGDEAAFDQLFTANYPALCDFVVGYVHAPDIAEELVQNVFLRIWEHRARWDPVGGARAYLFAACRHQALDHLKHDRIVARLADRASQEQLIHGLGSPPMRPDEAIQAAELSRALRHAVEQLPERRRLVVVLRWQHQLSYQEIADVLEISVKGVKTQFARAIAALRKHFTSWQS